MKSMAAGVAWDRPSEEVREMLRRGAQMTLDASDEWLAEMKEVALASTYGQRLAGDPVIATAIERSARECCLRWLAENISHPGEPVATDISIEELVAVRNVVSRGLDELAVMDAYRLAQNASLRYWTFLAFRLSSEPTDIRRLLDVCHRSIGSFVEAVVAELCAMIQAERGQLTRGSDLAVREIVGQLIDGALPPVNVEDRLGYVLNQHHTAIVLWSDEFDVQDVDLDRVARALADGCAGRQAPLVMRTDAATRWLWLPGQAGPDLTGAVAGVGQLPGTRIAVGPTLAGLEGFRRSHLDALTAQRMVARTGTSNRVVHFAEIELFALLIADPEQADRFVEHTLGGLASADLELRRTVLTFIHERYSASRAAARLFIHRNTLHGRLAQADGLLPRPLDDTHVRVAVALEILSWRRGERCVGPAAATRSVR